MGKYSVSKARIAVGLRCMATVFIALEKLCTCGVFLLLLGCGRPYRSRASRAEESRFALVDAAGSCRCVIGRGDLLLFRRSVDWMNG